MNATKITTPDFLDILFDGRNKSYGAYDHRVSYERRVRNSVFGTASIALLIIGGYLISSNLRAADVVERPPVREIPVMTNIEEPTVTPPPPPPPVEPAPRQQVATERFTTFEVTDKPVAPEEEPPRMEELENKAIGAVSMDGESGNNVDPGLLTGNGTGRDIVTPPPAPVEDETPLTIVEIMPEFPGGEAALNKFLRNNIRYPSVAAENGIDGTIFVTFVVGTDGSITDIRTVGAKKGGGLEEEALRVTRKMPKWKPGKQNSRAVRVQFNLPIRFQLENN